MPKQPMRQVKIDPRKFAECQEHGHYVGDTCPHCIVRPAPVPIPEPPQLEEETVDKSKWWTGLEKDLHSLFQQECLRREVAYIHSRTDQRSTIRSGWPDFSLFRQVGGKTLSCLVEFKTKTGRLRKDQEECIDELRRLGIEVLVTGDFFEAVEYIKNKLDLE